MLSPDEIKQFIDSDTSSEKKKYAKIGVRYYESDHDIKDYRMFFVDAEGKLKEDKYRSNIRISHPFFTEIVDQLVQFELSGEEGILRSDIPELQKELDYYFNSNEQFMADFEECVTGTIVKGSDCMYAYKNADDRTAFQYADSMGVVEVNERETDDHCQYLIFWYVDKIGKDNKKIKRIQVWDKSQTYFYCQVDDGNIVLDHNEKQNPRPHILYQKDGDENIYYDSFGFIPFFRMDYNRKQTSGLKPIKDIIDSYDLMNAGLANNIQDTSEALYVVKGFQGDNLDELMMNIKTKKHIGVDENGDVEIRTIDIPYEARKTKMEIDEKNIFRMGMAVNTEGLKDSNATVSVAIKSAYTLLEMKANKLETQIKLFMRKLLKVVLDEINTLNGTDYTNDDVYFKFEREIPTNMLENAQIELTEAQKRQTEINTVLSLATHLDNETTMQLICEQLDIDYNDIKDKLPDPEETDPYAMVEEVPGEEGVLIE